MGGLRIVTVGILCIGGAGIYQLSLPRGAADAQATSTDTIQRAMAEPTEATGKRSDAVLVRAVEKPAKRSRRASTGAAPAETARAAPAGEPRSSEPTAWVRVVGSRVNVRSGPESSAPRVTTYRKDTRLQLLEKQGEWIRVRHPSSESIGWMFGKYLRESQPPREALAERTTKTPG